MVPVTTPETNLTLVAPGCFDLPAHRNPAGFIRTAWRLELKDIENLKANGGIIYLEIYSGSTQPPVRLTTEAPGYAG